ncbi:unnamed protein product [Choristocarpus tenellus]
MSKSVWITALSACYFGHMLKLNMACNTLLHSSKIHEHTHFIMRDPPEWILIPYGMLMTPLIPLKNRIFMCMATLFTYPLVMQPVISIVEAGVASFLGLDSTSSTVAGYGALIESGGGETPATAGKLSFVQSMVVRGFLVILTGFFATSVPMFGVVVSLLGSFSISLGSFVLPPLFHFLCFGGQLGYWATTYDLLLFTVGTLTCVITTTITALSLVQ